MDFELLFEIMARHIDLTPMELECLRSQYKPQKIMRREYLLTTGDRCKYDYFITKGCVRSYFTDESDKEHNLMFAVEGWWTGNLHSFITRTPSLYTVEALEDTEVLKISKPNLEILYQKVPKVERFFRIMFQNNLIAQQYRLMNYISGTALERYAYFTHRYPGLDQRIPQKHIASYLGVSPAYLSRLRGKKARK
jgi:CRP-like cAMP-binding protein